jgi:nitroimidazol reductase NimA-like FMN-containing flavoprotein (pyridoxamine 5'-phosphate oxidase superfamily)
MSSADALGRLQEASYDRAARAIRNSWPREAAMTPAQLAAFLGERRYCVLATTTARDRAQARPVAFTVAAATFWFATVAGARLRNVRRTPWASLVVADGEGDSHRAVIADGPAAIAKQPPESLLALWEARHGSRAAWASAWFTVEPERLFSYRAAGAPG